MKKNNGTFFHHHYNTRNKNNIIFAIIAIDSKLFSIKYSIFDEKINLPPPKAFE